MKATIEFQWWRLSEETESGVDEVKHQHREALTETAMETIQHQAVQGYVEGELSDSVLLACDESEEETVYRGYWKCSPAASASYAISPEIQATMQKVREIADQACENAHAEGVRGAINWGDIGVAEIRFCINEQGEGVYDILIEEAAPGNVELMEYVAQQIGDTCKPHDLEIRTEW